MTPTPTTTTLIQPCAMPAVTILAAGAVALFVLPGAWKLLALIAVPVAMGKSLECLT